MNKPKLYVGFCRKLIQDRECSTTLIRPDSTTPYSSIEANDGENALGNEYDVEVVYNYTEDFQIGANVGIFLPGSVYSKLNNDPAKQAIIHGNLNF